MKRKRKEWQAYMTLEASLLMGWVIFLMVFFIYLTFYAYDRCVMFQDAYAFAFRVSIKPLDTERKTQYGNQKMQEQFGKKYFGVSGVNTTLWVDHDTVTVKARCQVEHPFSDGMPTLPESGWENSCEVHATIQNPTEMLRNFSRLRKLAGNVIE